MRKPLMWASKIKRLVFFGTLDNFTFKVYRRREWEAGVLHGIEYDEQRIIKLLEMHKCIEPVGHPYDCYCDGMKLAIALIKGEK